jgi:hypothetical protein
MLISKSISWQNYDFAAGMAFGPMWRRSRWDADWRHGNLGMAKILLFFTQATANSPLSK